MKALIASVFLILSFLSLKGQNIDRKNYDLKNKVGIFLSGGGAEFIKGEEGGIFPVTGGTVAYQISNRLSLIGDAIFYFPGFSNPDDPSPDQPQNFSYYGIGVKYIGRRDLRCGTGTIQSGAYVFNYESNKIDWLLSPGWMYPVGKKEKLFLNMIFDFQMNKIFRGEASLITARVGMSVFL
jgi:hypothetical protein